MTESESPRVHLPPIVVLGVQPNDPPFRLIEVAGEVIGKAHSVLDVIEIARVIGMEDADLDDPDVVRWVGGDKFTWTSWRLSGRSRGKEHGEKSAKGEKGEGPGETRRHHRWRS
ncbi:hypothetical protein SBI_06908 [Streptomyces bingchenggensis BCW-1]|uniref:Uncharacterized protein n=1 Tax=Streptomyces bingchenggensis (strain BCW-1) TaxID=749414 RepID=D7C1G3_STRBB|nr:hypothetical protein SBI_06908 [Streptomyces bingchenggensis BCW-1]